jgi:hypothetical protein
VFRCIFQRERGIRVDARSGISRRSGNHRRRNLFRSASEPIVWSIPKTKGMKKEVRRYRQIYVT